MYDITKDELTRVATRDGDDWIINNVRHHVMVAAYWEDGEPRTTFLRPCGEDWCLHFYQDH